MFSKNICYPFNILPQSNMMVQIILTFIGTPSATSEEDFISNLFGVNVENPESANAY